MDWVIIQTESTIKSLTVSVCIVCPGPGTASHNARTLGVGVMLIGMSKLKISEFCVEPSQHEQLLRSDGMVRSGVQLLQQTVEGLRSLTAVRCDLLLSDQNRAGFR